MGKIVFRKVCDKLTMYTNLQSQKPRESFSFVYWKERLFWHMASQKRLGRKMA